MDSSDNGQTAKVSKTLNDNKTADKSVVCDDTDKYPAWFLERLQEFRSEGHLVDVTLCAEGKEIPCHRLVLSGCSDYFHAMFNGAHSESKKDKVDIGGLSADTLQLLVDYAYTSKVRISTDNVQPLYEAANMLQVGRVEEGCEDFLADHLRPETCLETWALADKLSNTHLSAMARGFALKHFEEVCTTEEFLELPAEFLKTYISEGDLHAEKEERVLEAILLWVRHDLEERQTHLKELLECVRFSHVDQDYLKDIMEKDKVLSGVSGMKELIKDQSVQARSCQTFQGEILIFGGFKDKEREDKIKKNYKMYRLDIHGKLVERTQLPQPRLNFRGSAACVVNNDVIVTGGEKYPSQAWRYSRSSRNSWTKLGSLRKRRYGHGMAVLQGKVYVVGGVSVGNSHSHVKVTEVYNELTDSWDKVAPLLQAVSSFGIATCCDKIYVFGGDILNSFREQTDVQCYNPALNAWTFATPLPESLSSINACTVNSKIYLIGGLTLAHILCYDPQEDCYSEMADSLAPWEHSSATVCGSEIYITGGMYDDDEGCCNGSSKVQCYNVNSDTMIRVQDLPVPLWSHISVTIPKL
ncbi:kelch-like protein 24 [Branchiostoma lanceolatum]|uniref:kelch-like protein 24 n=1 Tax=Branchiostoma lanceolatum TaxID=7740 RepID=UPI00345532F1